MTSSDWPPPWPSQDSNLNNKTAVPPNKTDANHLNWLTLWNKPRSYRRRMTLRGWEANIFCGFFFLFLFSFLSFISFFFLILGECKIYDMPTCTRPFVSCFIRWYCLGPPFDVLKKKVARMIHAVAPCIVHRKILNSVSRDWCHCLGKDSCNYLYICIVQYSTIHTILVCVYMQCLEKKPFNQISCRYNHKCKRVK